MSGDKSDIKPIGFNVQKGYEINGEHTEMAFRVFANRWLLVVTQSGKLPSIFTVQFDSSTDQTARVAVDDPEFHQSTPITVICNFGVDKNEIRNAIQFLVDKTKLSKCPKECVISLALHEINETTLRELVQVINKHML